MITAADIAQKYLTFFKDRGHSQIPNSPLVLQNDPTTLFTSSGMQPLVPYLLGEAHPQGTRLVNVQNSFRAVDIDEVGDNRHTTFFRMLGNWSLGDYFKDEQLTWIFAFLTDKKEGLGIDPNKLFITVFAGDAKQNVQTPGGTIPLGIDADSTTKWIKLFEQKGITAQVVDMTDPTTTPLQIAAGRIFDYGVEKNWWSRSGVPEKMPPGEPGGPDSEIFYDFGDPAIHENSPFNDTPCHVNCDCGRYIEICNSVFMQYQKQADGTFKDLPKQNVDFGGGLERQLMAIEDQSDVFKTNLFWPIIETLQQVTNHAYADDAQAMRVIADHFTAAVFIAADGVKPSKSEQGYILRRLIRRAYDHLNIMRGFEDITMPTKHILQTIVDQYKTTDPYLVDKFVEIEQTILEEATHYRSILSSAKKSLDKEIAKRGIHRGDELFGTVEIPSDLAFKSAASLGLGPLQLKSLGYTFDDQAYAEEVKKHQALSRAGAEKKFKGGLADHTERTVMGHTATHLLHQALRDVLGKHVHQSGSNITTERIRFDFNYENKLTDEQISEVQTIVNQKIQENIPVHFEMIKTEEAKKLGAIGLFEDTYADVSKIYFIGPTQGPREEAYSIEFCGGPHVEFTGKLKSFKIIKQENLGKGMKRLYAVIE